MVNVPGVGADLVSTRNKKRHMRMGLLGVICLFVGSGCVHTRAYLAERERVDQKVEGVAVPEKPKIRQVLVLEFVEDDPRVPPAARQASGVKTASVERPVGVSETVASASSLDVAAANSAASPAFVSSVAVPVEYKVEKDDTLQKISHRFYGSYSKWTRIYDENKAVIKDPNRLKTGILLKIPAP